jgi:hypothetical protein
MLSVHLNLRKCHKVNSKLVGMIACTCIPLFASAGYAQPIDMQAIYVTEVLDGELPVKQACTAHFSELNEQNREMSGFENSDLHRVWSLSRSDLSLRRAVMSWVQSEGWRLQWDAAWDAPILHDKQFDGDFVTALHDAITTLASGHLFALIDEENHIVRITAVGVE